MVLGRLFHGGHHHKNQTSSSTCNTCTTTPSYSYSAPAVNYTNYYTPSYSQTSYTPSYSCSTCPTTSYQQPTYSYSQPQYTCAKSYTPSYSCSQPVSYQAPTTCAKTAPAVTYQAPAKTKCCDKPDCPQLVGKAPAPQPVATCPTPQVPACNGVPLNQGPVADTSNCTTTAYGAPCDFKAAEAAAFAKVDAAAAGQTGGYKFSGFWQQVGNQFYSQITECPMTCPDQNQVAAGPVAPTAPVMDSRAIGTDQSYSDDRRVFGTDCNGNNGGYGAMAA